MERNNVVNAKFGESVDPRTVIIVEDDITLQNHWISIFEELPFSFEIVWTTSAEEFEVKLREKRHQGERFDFIISDIFLSGSKNGIDLWREFTSSCEYFILMSDISPQKFDNMLKRDLGRRPMLLSKPLDPAQCLETMEYLLYYSRKNTERRIEA